MSAVNIPVQHLIGLPTELLQLVGSFDVPLSEVAGVIAGLLKMLRPVRLVRAKNALVVIYHMLDVEDPVIVWKQARHQTGACWRAGG